MLPDNVIVNLVEEANVVIQEKDISDLVVNIEDTSLAVIEMTSVVPVVVDTESMSSSDLDNFIKYGRVQRVLFFVKSVLGKKTTFASMSFNLQNNFQTNGTALINPANHNLVNRQTVFGKAVSGKRTTFARVALGVLNTIQVAASNTSGSIRFYGSGLYGSGTYGDIIGYGAGVYGIGIYAGEAIHVPLRFGSVISGAVLVKQTSVAEVSLAPHGAPQPGTQHAIKVRARTLTGSTGILKAALYEGSINRSGDLSTIPLTNTLTDYTLYIPEEISGGVITDYSNLSIRFWGYDPAGNPLVFQVSRIFLELPIVTGSTKFGATSSSITFGKAVSGSITNKRTATAEISLASHGIPVQRTDHTIKIRARTILEGQNAVIKAALYEGLNNRSGDLITPPLTTTFADYELVIPDYLAFEINDYANLSLKFWGYDVNGNPAIFEISRIYLELPVSSGNVTLYGVINRPITFVKAVNGVIGAGGIQYGIVSRAITFTKAVAGISSSPGTHFGSVSRATTFTKAVSGKATLMAVVARSTTFTKDVSGSRKTFGVVARPTTFTKAVVGYRKYLGVVARSTTFTKSVAGFATHFAVVARSITFTKAVAGIISSKKTATAEISLASHGTPSVRTNHSIKVRARTTSGSTGVLKAELYEGSTVRSGSTPLVTSALTTSLADYTLAIPDAAAATITSYSDLSIKFWGYDSAGNALVFEVSRIYLELPTP